jgi:hypothetical protein
MLVGPADHPEGNPSPDHLRGNVAAQKPRGSGEENGKSPVLSFFLKNRR